MSNKPSDSALMYFLMDSTGETRGRDRVRVIDCHVGEYLVSVLIDEDDKFVGVKSVAVDREFLSFEERARRGVVHDVERYYED